MSRSLRFARALVPSMAPFRTHALRTWLTLLGVVFGVASVVAMVSIGEGAKREILASIEAMGARNLHILGRPADEATLGERVDESAGLSRADVAALQTLLAEAALPTSQAGFRRRYAPKTSDLSVPVAEVAVLGVSERLPSLHGLKTAAGRPLLPTDHRDARAVALLGGRLAEAAFGTASPVGRWIRLEGHLFEVVGVLAPTSSAGNSLPVDPQRYERAVVVPVEALDETLAPPAVYGDLELITLELPSMADTLPAKAVATATLLALHGQAQDFEVVAPEELLRQREATQSVLNAVLVSIAAISLLVGGIGVMNIMLANILERVPEIGLRRALGATRRDIRDQFLAEALSICLVGGLSGIALGLGLAFGVSRLAALPVAFAWSSVALSFGLSSLVGLIFGLFPALKAAQISPVEALRRG